MCKHLYSSNLVTFTYSVHLSIVLTNSVFIVLRIAPFNSRCTKADSSASNYAADANKEEVPSSCTYAILGCTIAFALNFDSVATVNDDNCRIGSPPMIYDGPPEKRQAAS